MGSEGAALTMHDLARDVRPAYDAWATAAEVATTAKGAMGATFQDRGVMSARDREYEAERAFRTTMDTFLAGKTNRELDPLIMALGREIRSNGPDEAFADAVREKIFAYQKIINRGTN